MTEITEENFSEHFRDARTNRPRAGEIMAKFAAMADFVDGSDHLKRDVIDVLNRECGAKGALKMLQRLAGCRYKDALRILQEMASDLQTMTAEEVLEKPYRFACEFFFYCKRENVPHSPFWETIPLIDPTKWTNFEEVMAQIEKMDQESRGESAPEA